MANKSKLDKNQAMIDHVIEVICADYALESRFAEALSHCTCYSENYTSDDFSEWLSSFDIKENVSG